MIFEIVALLLLSIFLGMITGFFFILLKRRLFARKAEKTIENQRFKGGRREDFIKAEDLPIVEEKVENQPILPIKTIEKTKVKKTVKSVKKAKTDTHLSEGSDLPEKQEVKSNNSSSELPPVINPGEKDGEES